MVSNRKIINKQKMNKYTKVFRIHKERKQLKENYKYEVKESNYNFIMDEFMKELCY